jgi:hypothetical protein
MRDMALQGTELASAVAYAEAEGWLVDARPGWVSLTRPGEVVARVKWFTAIRRASSRVRCNSLWVFLIFLAAYRDRYYVGAATSSKLTIGTGDQDDAIALTLASNMTATDLDVSEIAGRRSLSGPGNFGGRKGLDAKESGPTAFEEPQVRRYASC